MTGPEDTVEATIGLGLPGIDPDNVQRWLVAHVDGMKRPIEFDLVAAGGSNLTYRLVDGTGTRYILRRPPIGTLLPTAHDMAREHRIMTGLADSVVPVPQMLVLCDDESVCGARFYVMSYADGLILRDTDSAVALGEEATRRASTAFVDTLAAMHTLEPASVGLDTLSRPDGYVERQLRRWFSQYEKTAGAEPDPLIAELHDRLAAGVPLGGPSRTGRLLHGDYHIDNVVFDDDLAVVAVLDWELCTLGDPLADLCWALMFWTTGPDEFAVVQSSPSLAPGMLSRPEFVQRYGAVSGIDLDAVPYFLTLSHWKLACLIQGSLYRRAAGQGGGLQASGAGVAGQEGRQRLRLLVQRTAELASAAAI